MDVGPRRAHARHGEDLLATVASDAIDLTPSEVVGGVLDCPGGWTGDPVRETAVLGRMSARIEAAPRPGAPHVVVGWLDSGDGHTAVDITALYGPDGELVGAAGAVWIRLSMSAG